MKIFASMGWTGIKKVDKKPRKDEKNVTGYHFLQEPKRKGINTTLGEITGILPVRTCINIEDEEKGELSLMFMWMVCLAHAPGDPENLGKNGSAKAKPQRLFEPLATLKNTLNR